MTKDEALKLALEALHGFIPYLPLNDEAQCGRYDKAITAIRETLAQPEHGWTPERIAGMSRLKEAQDKKLAQPSVSVEKKLSSFQEEELMQQQVRDFMRSH